MNNKQLGKMLSLNGRVARHDIIDIQAHSVICLVDVLDSRGYSAEDAVDIAMDFIQRIGADWQVVADLVGQSRRDSLTKP